MAKATLGALTPSHVIRKNCYSGSWLFLACLAVQLLFLFFLAPWRLGGVLVLLFVTASLRLQTMMDGYSFPPRLQLKITS